MAYNFINHTIIIQIYFCAVLFQKHGSTVIIDEISVCIARILKISNTQYNKSVKK